MTPMVGHALVGPGELWGAWSPDPTVLAGLGAAGLLYARGYRTIRRRSPHPTADLRAGAFLAGWLVIVVALVSPLDAMADALFSAHMVQHLLLIVVAAPLFVLGRPVITTLAGLSPERRRRVARAAHALAATGVVRTVRRPVVAWSVFTIALWSWHLPVLYQAAVEDPLLHALEHTAFLSTAMLAWSVALDERPREGMGVLGRALFLSASAVQSGLLGALILFASTLLYPVHGPGPALWGLTPLQDQQLAGALMWIPPAAVYLTATGAILLRTFRAMDASRPARRAGGSVAA
ncbi:MAG TPA: cytochrome c oxidase assembly protein [Actinomycetota bacterium]|jgi:cytochrome c oxidase assembly factor CtaG|nr:cytochrome c oxidase assembly protein [Actinomycetota bacterium]